MCYISAFLIGEIFLNLGRSLKPFNPIIGETYEYFDNEKKFRFYAEQVSHKPQVTAYIAETPEFAYYGDTLNTTSFPAKSSTPYSLANSSSKFRFKTVILHFFISYSPLFYTNLL